MSGDGKFGPAPESLGPYVIESRIGSGGMGAVYRAHDERLDRRVAIKYIRADDYDTDSMRQRFHREARAAAQINHPAIVQIFDFVQEEDGDWIVMEFVDGRTLDKLLRTGGPLDLATGLPILREVAYGLAEAHRLGVVHRDIKTENVMITTDGRVKILDFGVARRVVADNPMDQALTLDGMIIGTPHAMSPEQANGSSVDHRTDLFSFGSLAYQTLTGVVPFGASNPIKTLYRVCTDHPPPAHEHNPEIPPELSRMIERLLAKQPEDRPQEARQVARFLDRLVGLDVSGYFSLVLDAAPDHAETPSGEAGAGIAGAGNLEATGVEPLLAATRRQAALLHVELGEPGLFDAETLLRMRPVFRSLVAEVRDRFGGTGAGEGDRSCCILFGAVPAPPSRGDEVRRAVHAGREILRLAARRLTDDGALALRAAVHAGRVVVDGDISFLGVTGDTTAAMIAVAPAGSLVTSAAALRHLRLDFEHRALDAVTLTGTEEEVPVVRLLSPLAILPPPEPFLGRRQELEILQMAWRWVGLGRGQAVLVSGPPGVGKSHLLAHFCHQAQVRPLLCRASSADADTPLATVNRLLRQALTTGRGASEGNTEPEPADLEKMARNLSLTSEEIVPLLAGQLGMKSRTALPEMSEDERRTRVGEAVLALLTELAHREPVCLMIEDVHWADTASRHFLDRLVARLARARILAVLTFRTEKRDAGSAGDFAAAWRGSHVSPLTLHPMAEENSRELIAVLSGEQKLSPGQRGWISSLAAGIPLIVEELTRAALESPSTAGPSSDPPGLVHELVQPEIDALEPPARDLLRLSAVVGREVTPPILAAVAGRSPGEIREGLEELVEAGLLRRSRESGDDPQKAAYSFSREILREVAAASLLQGARRRLHERVASVLSEKFPEFVRTHPEVLAGHRAAAQRIWF